jgi:hypothetical protein
MNFPHVAHDDRRFPSIPFGKGLNRFRGGHSNHGFSSPTDVKVDCVVSKR